MWVDSRSTDNSSMYTWITIHTMDDVETTKFDWHKIYFERLRKRRLLQDELLQLKNSSKLSSCCLRGTVATRKTLEVATPMKSLSLHILAIRASIRVLVHESGWCFSVVSFGIPILINMKITTFSEADTPFVYLLAYHPEQSELIAECGLGYAVYASRRLRSATNTSCKHSESDTKRETFFNLEVCQLALNKKNQHVLNVLEAKPFEVAFLE
ncbi:hypothetical protein Tco_1402985 [Tanacetum coccineum]